MKDQFGSLGSGTWHTGRLIGLMKSSYSGAGATRACLGQQTRSRTGAEFGQHFEDGLHKGSLAGCRVKGKGKVTVGCLTSMSHGAGKKAGRDT